MRGRYIATSQNMISIHKICVVALAVVLNVLGGHIALMLHLPIYLDSMGTVMAATIYGPFIGALPALVYGLVMGCSVDIYALYFMPVGMLLGVSAGIVSKIFPLKKSKLIAGAFIITLPSTVLSSVIAAAVFGGVTSSGSTIIVQILNKLGLPLVTSVFAVQFGTDYLDRLISLILVSYVLNAVPANLINGGEAKK